MIKYHSKHPVPNNDSNISHEYKSGILVLLFKLTYSVFIGSGSHPASIQWVLGALSLGVKWPRHEADHSPPLPHTPSWDDA
jgi:hypothetical protein